MLELLICKLTGGLELILSWVINCKKNFCSEHVKYLYAILIGGLKSIGATLEQRKNILISNFKNCVHFRRLKL